MLWTHTNARLILIHPMCTSRLVSSCSRTVKPLQALPTKATPRSHKTCIPRHTSPLLSMAQPFHNGVLLNPSSLHKALLHLHSLRLVGAIALWPWLRSAILVFLHSSSTLMSNATAFVHLLSMLLRGPVVPDRSRVDPTPSLRALLQTVLARKVLLVLLLPVLVLCAVACRRLPRRIMSHLAHTTHNRSTRHNLLSRNHRLHCISSNRHSLIGYQILTTVLTLSVFLLLHRLHQQVSEVRLPRPLHRALCHLTDDLQAHRLRSDRSWKIERAPLEAMDTRDLTSTILIHLLAVASLVVLLLQLQRLLQQRRLRATVMIGRQLHHRSDIASGKRASTWVLSLQATRRSVRS